MTVKDLKKYYPDIYAFAKKRRDNYSNKPIYLDGLIRRSTFIDWSVENAKRKVGDRKINWNLLFDWASHDKLTMSALNYWNEIVKAEAKRSTSLYPIF